MTNRTSEELDAGLAHIVDAPADDGELRLIVRRPGVDERETLDEGVLDIESGLEGDTWAARGNPYSDDGRAEPLAQVTVMNSRAVEVIAGPVDRWPLAGDQLYVDLDLSEDNLPAGTRLAIGEALIEVTAKPHTGCAKFIDRYGRAAQRWVNSPTGRDLRLRGVNTRVVQRGTIRVGDRVKKV
ncbi:MAG: MOSC domain-containing protein [Acidobacteria bacterium]|nr:MOSC domain-containing protein [Acidobacteriota bacterium]